jgi:hypothetical protein
MSGQWVVFRRILALAALLGVACACQNPPESTERLLLGRMRQIAQASTLTIELIRNTLEVTLIKDTAASQDMVTFFVGKPKPGSQFEGLIKLVDCRVPTLQNTVLLEPFVAVELEAADGREPTSDAGRAPRLWRSDVMAVFGQPDSFQPELPENPESWGSCIYKVGGRALWFSLGRLVPEQVVTISVHSLQDLRSSN